MDVLEKLTILTDAAKYDAACTSSGGNRTSKKGYIGNTSSSVAGCCHSFSADGRCVTLLKVLLTNCCVYDCKYCVNRRSNDTRRAIFSPEELADLTIGFYRRNYIEGLFLSSGVVRSPDYTMELMIRTLRLLREQYRFNGYIHAKAIPGSAPELVEQLGLLADRLSVNIELPSEAGLKLLAPDKTRKAIFSPMGQIQARNHQNKEELVKYRACGMVFLVMNLALSVIIFFMVYWNRTFHHHEITTIAMAAYTFTALTIAIINVIKYRKYNSPVYSASKIISLASACVSMLTLESTMLTTFGAETMDLTERRIMLAASGGVISVFIITMAVYMIVQATKKINLLNMAKEHLND